MKLIFCVLAYLLIINAAGAFMMYNDKKKAINGEWRIREKTLFNVALAGGSVGVWLGGKRFRHKTKHPSFKYGIPLILFAQIALAAFIFYYFQDSLFG